MSEVKYSRCCNNCIFNVQHICTVLPGNWNCQIPVSMENIYFCKEHIFNEESSVNLNNTSKLLKECQI